MSSHLLLNHASLTVWRWWLWSYGFPEVWGRESQHMNNNVWEKVAASLTLCMLWDEGSTFARSLAPHYQKIVKCIVCIHSEPSAHSGYTVGQGKDLCASRYRNPVICHASDWSKYIFSHFELKVRYRGCKNSSGGSLCIFSLSSNAGFHQSLEMMPHSKWKKEDVSPFLVFEVLKDSLMRFDLTFYKLISH